MVRACSMVRCSWFLVCGSGLLAHGSRPWQAQAMIWHAAPSGHSDSRIASYFLFMLGPDSFPTGILNYSLCNPHSVFLIGMDEEKLEELIPEGMTNLWDGLKNGMELLKTAQAPGRLQHVMLFTESLILQQGRVFHQAGETRETINSPRANKAATTAIHILNKSSVWFIIVKFRTYRRPPCGLFFKSFFC